MWPAHDPDLIRSFVFRLVSRQGFQGAVRCEPWQEGASNSVWRLDVGNRGLVLKVGKHEEWRRLGVEASVLRCIAGRGAPLPICQGSAGDDLPWDWSVQTRIPGRHPPGLGPKAAAELGRTLARLRQIDFGPHLAWRSWREFVSDRIRTPLAGCARAPEEALARISDALDRAERKAAVGDRLDGLPRGVVHGDLIPLNLVERVRGAMWLLDWENPRLGSLCWDLAGVRKAFRLDAGAWETMIVSVGEVVPPECVDFADALQNLQVATWRIETWWGRGIHTAGSLFLEELDRELGTAQTLLSGI